MYFVEYTLLLSSGFVSDIVMSALLDRLSKLSAVRLPPGEIDAFSEDGIVICSVL